MVREFEFVNFFRAIAALWVLVAHCMIWGGWYWEALPAAKIAVNLFMLISGFLMMANATARKDSEPMTTGKSWARFWVRRYFRLAPAYYLSLALAVLFSSYFLLGYKELQNLNPAWVGSDGGVYDPMRIKYTAMNVFLHLTLLFGLHPEYSFSTFLPDWSLSLEIQFYLVFPALFLVFRRIGVAKASLFIGVPVFLVGAWISSKVHYFEPALIVLRLNYFLAGMVLFSAMETEVSKRRRAGLIACAMALVYIGSRVEPDPLVLPSIFLLMLVIGLAEKSGRAPSWLFSLINNKAVRFASDTSYGVYLFHGFYIAASGLIITRAPFLLDLPPQQRVGVMLVFVLTGAYLTAYLVYKAVELPGIRLGGKINRSLFPSAQKPVTA
ncbi:acyltransferase [Pseudomonas sp. BN414]|uniref:acyltransferase family protein n=1 Tax=Pseudomonas sp. BN414 TaxID=2567888 RepID=UPI002458FF3E|nr:acyltransferase [Pseudomonas sp. BN414]MDH4570038.1 acyltransferase [Pseudomonas sp. BN414]